MLFMLSLTSKAQESPGFGLKGEMVETHMDNTHILLAGLSQLRCAAFGGSCPHSIPSWTSKRRIRALLNEMV